MRKGEGIQEGIQGELNPSEVQTSIYHETKVGQNKKIVALRGDDLDVST